MMRDSSEEKAWKCAVELKLDVDTIFTCANKKLGNDLHYAAGRKTPKHTFIPWIVVDKRSGDDFNDLVISNLTGVICHTYAGQKPKHCHK